MSMYLSQPQWLTVEVVGAKAQQRLLDGIATKVNIQLMSDDDSKLKDIQGTREREIETPEPEL